MNWFSATGRQTHKQTDRQTDEQADRQTDRRTGRQTHKQAGGQIDRQTHKQAGGQIERETDRQNCLISAVCMCTVHTRTCTDMVSVKMAPCFNAMFEKWSAPVALLRDPCTTVSNMLCSSLIPRLPCTGIMKVGGAWYVYNTVAIVNMY